MRKKEFLEKYYSKVPVLKLPLEVIKKRIIRELNKNCTLFKKENSKKRKLKTIRFKNQMRKIANSNPDIINFKLKRDTTQEGGWIGTFGWTNPHYDPFDVMEENKVN